MSDPHATSPSPAPEAVPPKPLGYRQRRILGVLMEKARTTPDAYPLSLNGLVTGCNQKSNRHPLMDLTPEQVEDELEKMRAAGVVAEVQGGSRVSKYRHFGYDYMGVKGTDAAVMTELLLRGEQTAGDLRTRAGRFESIADLQTLQKILDSLIQRKLVVSLTPAGRGQLFTHNLYLPEELQRLKQLSIDSPDSPLPPRTASAVPTASSRGSSVSDDLLDSVSWLQEEVRELRQLVEKLTDRLDRLEN